MGDGRVKLILKTGDVMEERERVAKYGRLIHEKGLVIGAGGNISEKDNDTLIIKKKGVDMSGGNIEDYTCIPFSEAGKESAFLSSETPLHLACYKARGDVQAVMHVHSPMIIAAATRTDLLESPSYEFDCVLGGSVPVIDYIQPGSTELAVAVAEVLSEGANAVMMRRHGAVSVGKDLEESYLRMLALERACIAFLHSA